MPETTIKKSKLNTGETVDEISNIIKKYYDSIIQLDNESMLIAPWISFSPNNQFTYVTLNTAIEDAPTTVGTFYWDEQDGVPTVVLANSKLQVGKEMYVDGLNKLGTTVSNGAVTFVNGAQGNRATIGLADADNYSDLHKLIGLATHDIANNETGNITTIGVIRDIDTSAYTEGDELFVSTTAGAFTTVTPSFGTGRWHVGIVTKSHVTQGEILVNVHEDKYMFGDPENNNFTGFEDDGTMVAKGDATAWEDLQFSVSSGKVPAANFPTFEAFTTNTQEYAFSVNDFIYLASNEPPHAHEANTTASLHLHVAPKTANSSGSSQYAKFQLDIAFVYGDGVNVWDERQSIGELEIPNGTPAKTGYIFNVGTFDLTNFGVGGQMKPTLKRIAATGGTEYADDVFITQLGMHYKVDMLGSRQMIVK